MATFSCFIHVNAFMGIQKQGLDCAKSSNQKLLQTVKLNSIRAKASGDDQRTKPNSIICADCDGNGAVVCSQCKGSGVNPVDFFDGQFKAGESCWLCGGKKDMLCGNCNGAGFLGGFMTSFDT